LKTNPATLATSASISRPRELRKTFSSAAATPNQVPATSAVLSSKLVS